jgi:hypothetical protein
MQLKDRHRISGIPVVEENGWRHYHQPRRALHGHERKVSI